LGKELQVPTIHTFNVVAHATGTGALAKHGETREPHETVTRETSGGEIVVQMRAGRPGPSKLGSCELAIGAKNSRHIWSAVARSGRSRDRGVVLRMDTAMV
jgi:hypothetical protein